MAIPKIPHPKYPITIPSTGQETFFTPILVKHQKAILMAQKTDDGKAIAATLQDVIKDCLDDDVDVTKLRGYDCVYIFAQIRSKSIGEKIDVLLFCNFCEKENESARVKVKLDLSAMEIVTGDGHTNNIKLTDDGIGVVMKYPSLSMAIEKDGKDIKMADCIESVYTADEVVEATPDNHHEIETFVDNLTRAQGEKLIDFFTTMPKLSKIYEFDCPVCNKHNKVEIGGMRSLFM